MRGSQTKPERCGIHLGHECSDTSCIPVGEDRRHVGTRVDQHPFERLELGEGLSGGDRDFGLLARQARLICREGVGGDGNRRAVGCWRQWVVGQDDIGREELGQTGDRDGSGPAYLTQRSDTDDGRRRLSATWPCEGRCRPGEPHCSHCDGGVGERSDPLNDGASDQGRDDQRGAPREDTPPTSRRAQTGDDLQLVLARWRELSAQLGESILALPGQGSLPRVGRTLAVPAVCAVHGLNAKSVKRCAVGTSPMLIGGGDS